MRKRTEDLGRRGLNADLLPWQLEDNEWSALGNARCRDGYVGLVEGFERYFATTDDKPLWLLPATDQQDYFWMVAGLTSVRAYNGALLVDITGATPFTGTEDNRWSGGALGTVPIITNGVDAPRYWPQVSTSRSLELLPYDDTRTWVDAGYQCRIIRPFRDLMVAMGIFDADGDHPMMVHWSQPADPGSPPPTWDYTQPDNLSGRFDIATSIGARTSGRIIDGLHIGNRFFVYKTDSVWSLDFVGGQYVMNSKPIAGLRGMLAPGCVVEVEGTHVVLGDEDLYVHNGNRPRSLINGRLQKDLFQQISPEHYGRSYLVKNRARNEVWVCVPRVGSEWPDLAVIWNFRDDTISIRDLPGCPHIERGIVVTADADPETWDTISASTWLTWPGTWGGAQFSRINDYPVGIVHRTGTTPPPEEKIDDNGFDDPLYWTTVDTPQGTAVVSGGLGRISASYQFGASYPEIRRAAIFKAGETYTVSWDIIFFSGPGVLHLKNGTQLIAEESASGSHQQVFVADQDGDFIFTVDYPAASDFDISVFLDNISIIGPGEGGGSDDGTIIFDRVFTVDGLSQTCFLERTGLQLDDDVRMKTMTAVYPRVKGSAALNVSVGVQSSPDSTITWKGPFPFNAGIDRKISVRATGAFHSIRFESAGSTGWSLSGYTLEYEPAGER